MVRCLLVTSCVNPGEVAGSTLFLVYILLLLVGEKMDIFELRKRLIVESMVSLECWRRVRS